MLADRVHTWIESVEGRGLIRAILDLVHDGELAPERARIRLQHLHDQRRVTTEQLAEALRTLA